MEFPSPYPLHMTQLATAAVDSDAAWHVVGLLLGRRRPARPSDLPLPPDFTRFLCSIPDSPLRLADGDLVTLSRIGVAALAHFFANSDLATRYLDLHQLVPRLLANFRSDCLVRTYCRKRKRAAAELEDFPKMKRKSFFQDLDGAMTSNQMPMEIPSKFRNVTQGIQTLSSLPSLSFDCWKLEGDMSIPVPNVQSLGCLHRMNSDSCSLSQGWTPHIHRITADVLTNSVPSQLSHPLASSNSEDGRDDQIIVTQGKSGAVPNVQSLGCLHRMNSDSCSLSQGWTPHIHRITADVLTNSVPSQLSHPLASSNSEDGRDDQIIVTQGKSGAVTKGCDSLIECVDEKIKIVLMHDSGSCKDHKENQQIDGIHKNMYHIGNPNTALPKSNDKGQFIVRPRTEDHMQSQGDMLNHSNKHSSGLDPDKMHEAYDRKKTTWPTKENRKRLSDKGRQKLKRDKSPISVKQTKQNDCDRIGNIKEKRDTSKVNREKASSVSNNLQQAPFPEFESFIVEEQEGSGGYGTVYRAKRKADGVVFAIKCPHVNANRNCVNNEVKMLERFGGKNFVIKYEGSFKSRSADCLVLQHVQHDRPENLKREMNVTDLQWYGYCLFKALAGLHRQGIVHRDVKPGNFLYSCKINKGYLIDFNLALDTRKNYGTVDNFKVQRNLNDSTTVCRTKSLQPAKSRKLIDANNEGKVCRSLLPPGNLKRKVDKAKVITEASSRNMIKSQGADGSGITSAKDATSTRTLSAERLREPLPSHGRRELLSLVQEALQGGNHESVGAPKSKRKRVAALAGDAGSTLLHITPMPLHANGLAIRGAGLKSKGDGKPAREGPCAGTKGFKAPEVLFRSPHQGPKADIWSAGVTLLYLMIGRTPFAGDTEQNIKEIAKLRGSEDLWEVAKLHNHESVFPMDLLDVKYLSPVNIREWCARNTRRPDFLRDIPRSLFDLVDKCLVVNPRRRISAEEALSHEFFAPCCEAIRKHRLLRQGLSNDAEASPLLHGEAEP